MEETEWGRLSGEAGIWVALTKIGGSSSHFRDGWGGLGEVEESLGEGGQGGAGRGGSGGEGEGSASGRRAGAGGVMRRAHGVGVG